MVLDTTNINKIEIYQDPSGETQIEVQFKDETLWLTQSQIVSLFDSSKANISEHIKHILKSNELNEEATVRKFRTVQMEGNRKVTRNLIHYNQDMIISIGYRVNSIRGVQFRQWANIKLKELLVEGYSINQQRLEQKEQEVKFLKSGIQILSRAIEQKAQDSDIEWLNLFSKGLELLDDYDHESLDTKGRTFKPAEFPSWQDYQALISEMRQDFESNIFAKEKNDSFQSSI